MSDHSNVIVVIPAYEPPEEFVAYVKDAADMFGKVVVVNDGSGSSYAKLFQQVENFSNVEVLSYDDNKGKGHALKYAFSWCITECKEDDIIVTADCDGQHSLQDVGHVADTVKSKKNALVIGVRDFSGENVPKRSFAGNAVMKALLHRLYKIRISDTQTGLRGFSISTAKTLTNVEGDRFEYETHVLIYAKLHSIPIQEIKIETVYPSDEKDHVSHFRTIRDSLPIARIMLKNLNIRVLFSFYEHEQTKTLFYNKFAGFVLWLGRRFSRPYYCQNMSEQAAAVYVCRHLNMHGPYTTMKWLPFQVHPMVLNVFFDRKNCYEQFSEYTFSERYGKKAKRFNLKAFMASLAVPKLVNGLKAVPVFRSSNSAYNTFKQGIRYLQNGESLIVWPDVDYIAGYEKESEIYSGFLYMGEMYYKQTGENLKFIPILIDDEQRMISIGKPAYLTDFRKESEEVSDYLKKSINK